MVHRRELNGQEVVFGNQGALWGNAMTWWEHETGSIWSQPLGEAIAGPQRGERLELLPSTLTTWEAWLDEHPETLAMNGRGGTGGFDLRSMAVVVDFGIEAAAYPITELRTMGPANDVVAGEPVVVLVDPSNEERWAVFSRVVGDRTLAFEIRDGELFDVDTETRWDPVRGRALEGPLQGEQLAALPGFTSFPEDFVTFWPNGRFWPPGRLS